MIILFDFIQFHSLPLWTPKRSQNHRLFPKLFFRVIGGWCDVFLHSLCPWACFPKLSNSQLILSCTSRWSLLWFWQLHGILVQSLFGLLGSSSYKSRAKFSLLFLPYLRPRAYPFMNLSFFLPILNGPWLKDWAFLIFKGPLVLDFKTCNILNISNI